MGESEVVQVQEVEGDESETDEQKTKVNPEQVHQLIEIAGWAAQLARKKTNKSDVLNQLSQASVDLRQANEALRAFNPEIPLHLESQVDRFKEIGSSFEKLKNLLGKEGDEQSSGSEKSSEDSSSSG